MDDDEYGLQNSRLAQGIRSDSLEHLPRANIQFRSGVEDLDPYPGSQIPAMSGPIPNAEIPDDVDDVDDEGPFPLNVMEYYTDEEDQGSPRSGSVSMERTPSNTSLGFGGESPRSGSASMERTPSNPRTQFGDSGGYHQLERTLPSNPRSRFGERGGYHQLERTPSSHGAYHQGQAHQAGTLSTQLDVGELLSQQDEIPHSSRHVATPGFYSSDLHHVGQAQPTAYGEDLTPALAAAEASVGHPPGGFSFARGYETGHSGPQYSPRDNDSTEYDGYGRGYKRSRSSGRRSSSRRSSRRSSSRRSSRRSSSRRSSSRRSSSKRSYNRRSSKRRPSKKKTRRRKPSRK